MKTGAAFFSIQPQRPSRTFVPVATIKDQGQLGVTGLGEASCGQGRLFVRSRASSGVWEPLESRTSVLELPHRGEEICLGLEGGFSFVCALQLRLMQKAKGS